MKKIILALGLLGLATSCSWLHHTETNWGSSDSSISGPGYTAGRGTTGVGSGADSGPGITGSDAAPPAR